jgi:type IV pilus assembly protein PilO
MGENKRLFTFTALGLLLLLSVGGIYSYFGILSPLHQKIASVDSEIKQQKTFLEKSISPVEAASASNENTFSLQEEVPVKPLVDQLILQLEKAEVLSDSLIMTMQFSDGEAKDDEEENAEETGSAEQENSSNNAETTQENVSNEEDSIETASISKPAPEILPEGVKKITAEISVVSKNYESLLTFLQTIEELKRVTVIEAITFSGLDEIEMASPDASPDQLKYEITIAAYYLPELTDYLNDLPKGEFPAPNGKENPLIEQEKD